MKKIESHPNEQFVPYPTIYDEVIVEIPDEHWLRNGQVKKIIFHDAYIYRDVSDPHTIHVRKR